MENYLPEIRSVVDRYSRIRKDLRSLDEQAKALTLRKNSIELELSRVREDEASLIDKIKVETGEDLDYYKIIREILKND